MGRNMTQTIKIDKQGRLVIPAEYRKILSLSEGTEVEIDLLADGLRIRKVQAETKQSIKKWKERILLQSTTAFSEKDMQRMGKWYSEDYVKNKLGL